jgi:hypothetical protein
VSREQGRVGAINGERGEVDERRRMIAAGAIEAVKKAVSRAAATPRDWGVEGEEGSKAGVLERRNSRAVFWIRSLL